ncbi:MAG: hypothetical protein WBP89_15060 [Sedimenticolaceae bacterium]
MNRLFRLFLIMVIWGIAFAPVGSTADGKGPDARNPHRCPYSKSLFVNLTSGDYRKSQVALRVLGANVLAVDQDSGKPIIGAEGHLFLADDSAVLSLQPQCWPTPLTEEELVLDEERQCLQQGFIDGQNDFGVGPHGVEGDESVPPVAFLLQQGVQVYGCAACMMDFLTESECELSLVDAKIDGVEPITPDNLTPFLSLYDRSAKQPRCEVDAAVISF